MDRPKSTPNAGDAASIRSGVARSPQRGEVAHGVPPISIAGATVIVPPPSLMAEPPRIRNARSTPAMTISSGRRQSQHSHHSSVSPTSIGTTGSRPLARPASADNVNHTSSQESLPSVASNNSIRSDASSRLRQKPIWVTVHVCNYDSLTLFHSFFL